MSTFRQITFVLLCVFAGAAAAADAASTDPKAVLRQTIKGCATGLERVIPGDYYFCAAARDLGRGHNARAAERLRDAAHWASKPAQYVLGLMYFNGDEGPANRPLGLAWLAIAAERHDPRFESAFVNAYTQSSPAEREQANQYWLTLRDDYGDRVAGRRAQRRYLAEMRNITASSMFGGSVFIDGLTPPGPEEGTFASGGGSRVSGQHGFSMQKKLEKVGDDYFRGMIGTVTVGMEEPVLVPIGQIAAKASPPAGIR